MEVLSEHICEGWLEGYLLTGRHGLFATYESFALIVASMIDAARQVARGGGALAVARADRVAQHPPDLDLLAQRPQRLQPSGAGLHGHRSSRREGPSRASICRPTRTACSRSPTTAFAARDYVNLIVIDKQPQLQWLDRWTTAVRACRARRLGLGVGEHDRAAASRTWSSRAPATSPTLETVAAAWWLRANAPELRVRVVNVVDLMTLFARRAIRTG